MTKYYPNKLSWLDIVTIREIQPTDVLSVIEQLMMLDYRAPFSASVSNIDKQENESMNVSQNTGGTSPFDKMRLKKTRSISDTKALHPMDIMNVVFNCSDNILLQALMEKLFLCRLSIPLIFPDTHKKKSIFLLWALRGIAPEFKSASNNQEKLPLVDIKQSFVSFFRIGRLHISKSKLLNGILSSKHHDTFFNRDCRYGMSPRIDSDGTIEASWYLPSGSDREEFKVMFTILNLRGESMKFLKQFQWLCSTSDLVFVMMNLKSLSNEQYLEFIELSKFPEAQFVVCFDAETFEQIDQYSESLQKCQARFTNYQIKIFDVLYNWSVDLGRLLSNEEWKTDAQEIIQRYLSSHTAKKTLSELEQVANEMGFRIDERQPLWRETFGCPSCNSLYQTTTEISNFIVHIDPAKRKLEVLPLQGELWLHWGQLKKEQYRRKLSPDESIDKFIAEKESQKSDVRKKQFEILQNQLSLLLIEIDSKLTKTNNAFAIQYFVNCLQLIFNKWSNADIPFLRNKYYNALKGNRKRWSKALDEDSKRKLRNENAMLSERINNASFGIKHIFREFGQMYETITSLPSNVEIPEKLQMISNYPHIMARMILHLNRIFRNIDVVSCKGLFNRCRWSDTGRDQSSSGGKRNGCRQQNPGTVSIGNDYCIFISLKYYKTR